MKQLILCSLIPWFLGACTLGSGVEVEKQSSSDLYGLGVRTLGGDQVSLEAYRGKVSLVVNTASRCGYTPQYEGLQTLYTTYQERGFTILGFPCNDFLGQEPGSAEEIRAFCTENFGVTFPMFEKVQVKSGEGQSELYRKLGEATGTLPSWNFGKYLVDRNGQVIQFFGTKVKPGGEEITEAIELALTQKTNEMMVASIALKAPKIQLKSHYADFPKEVMVEEKPLVLNGDALCEWGFLGFNLYRGALYVEQPNKDAEVLMEGSQTLLIHLHFVRALTAAQLGDAFRASVHYQVGTDSELEPDLQTLLSWMRDVKKGDPMSFAVQPGVGLTGFVKGKPTGRIENPEFAALFVRLYLGDKPPTEALKKGMLGL